jgi:hypothetical protein
VKLGDFGISIKTNYENNEDEKVYYVKGITPGFVT